MQPTEKEKKMWTALLVSQVTHKNNGHIPITLGGLKG